MINENSKTIAIDFDGTVVEDKFPAVGKPMMFAFETLKKLEGDGHKLVLWTYRTGRELKEAVEFCSKNGIEFYAINSSFEGEKFNEKEASRKINADIFVDDRNVGGFPGWGEVYQMISGEAEGQNVEKSPKKSRKRGLFRF